MSLIVKIILLELAFALSAPAADKTQFFVHLLFNYTLKYFNGTVIVEFSRISFFHQHQRLLIIKPYT